MSALPNFNSVEYIIKRADDQNNLHGSVSHLQQHQDNVPFHLPELEFLNPDSSGTVYIPSLKI